MVLCLGIIEDGLGRIIRQKNYNKTDNPFFLERYEIYHNSSIFCTGVLYLARAHSLPEVFSVQDNSALICIGAPPDPYLTSGMRLLVLSSEVDLIELSNDVNRIFFEYSTLEQKLQDSVNKGRSIQYMVDLMAPYLNSNELTVCDNDFRIIGKSNKILHICEISDVGQPDIDGFISPETVTFFKNDKIFNEVRNYLEPFIYESSIFLCRSICMNVFHNGEYACRTVLAEDANTFRGYEAGLLKFFTGFIQLVYDLSTDASKIIPRDNLADIFLDLLGGNAVESWRIENSIIHRQWQNNDSFLCLYIQPSERDIYTHTIPYYCQVFNRDISGCCFFEYNTSIVCVANLRYYCGSQEKFISTYREVFRDSFFHIGYSNIFRALSDLRYYYFQAKTALMLGQLHAPSIWFHKFSAIVLPYIKQKLTEDMDGRYLCAPEVMLLHEYDIENQTALVRTLRAYLENQMNAVKTASTLYIHRTTMSYRLERIRALTRIDYQDADKLLYIFISVKLLLDES